MGSSRTGEQDMFFFSWKTFAVWNLLAMAISDFIQTRDTLFLPVSPAETQVVLQKSSYHTVVIPRSLRTE